MFPSALNNLLSRNRAKGENACQFLPWEQQDSTIFKDDDQMPSMAEAL